jgi:hypothetical protein
MEKIVFVAFSDTLTQEQIEDLNADKIVLLADVNADLAAQCRQIDPTLSSRSVMFIAGQVVLEAIKVKATHFVCQGEAALAMWANVIASGCSTYSMMHEASHKVLYTHVLEHRPLNGMKCLQSTTHRELVSEVQDNGKVVKKTVSKHVQWRELF